MINCSTFINLHKSMGLWLKHYSIYTLCGNETCGVDLSIFCSALYVVDLKKFRETAAGDNLRVFYETLSKDPNSLSNLDQASG